MRTDATRMPGPGHTLGPWRVRRLLAEGGSAWIFGAEHTVTRRPAAIKVLRVEYAPDSEEARRFGDEIRATAAARHDHVVELLEPGESASPWRYCVLEALHGRSLRDLHEWEGVGSAGRAIAIARQIAAALAAVHAAGWVHGDLEPHNVLLVHRRGSRDYVKLIDFGLASSPSGEARRSVARRRDEIPGMPEYLAPEQLAGRPYDHRADLYSFGVLLYELVTGERPFAANGFDQLVIEQLTAEPAPPSSRPELPFALPSRLEELILQLLRKEPERRPTSMQWVVEELDAIAAEIREAPPRRSRRLVLALAGGTLIAGAALVAGADLAAAAAALLRRLLSGL